MNKPSATETEAADVLLHVLAESGTPESGGFNFINLLLPLALVVLIVLMFRKQRTAQKHVQEQRTQMVPGTAVMTNFGLFGTIVSIDQDANQAVLEISPGTHATVHMQVLTKVVEETAPSDPNEETPTVPDDASSLEHPGHVADVTETPQESADRLNQESKNKDN
ncbi:preprotein translocase subunit YajC [Arthrobacter roseus]|uniref:preprotein translocase subunit YajC n=1 Tax=Arthrobacter roseus TaxID=136274 RepID=UPI0030842559|nr:preprotein translocase subunit YajC [Arthrobacter roseus]